MKPYVNGEKRSLTDGSKLEFDRIFSDEVLERLICII